MRYYHPHYDETKEFRRRIVMSHPSFTSINLHDIQGPKYSVILSLERLFEFQFGRSNPNHRVRWNDNR
jgi:hypothetical protein